MKFPDHIVQTAFDSPLGRIMLAGSDEGLAGLWFVQGQRHMPDTSGWPAAPAHPLLLRAEHALQRYFAGEQVCFDLPLDLRSGTPFQQSVWQALLQIPRGSSTSYGLLSQRIGRPSAVRAVGAAVGHNPLGIIVPCHRVLGADGSLTGYAGGLDRKVALLQLEGTAFKPDARHPAAQQTPQQELPL
ncbi:MAG: methylated-DNA--[protein]-cysteine S-methyltransferase [Gammaproteobacteria bacterium]|nr:methylated-DNA--[protein]-cysteine S-methyltransferase [Gammaproteobacteria bacterium]MBU0787880.1 methylated-DNA--[protein]-cysteine S-methyltransferase [Gammaproteobacteria bacterium]MBU0817002.1 methylated-DNA--[protein]-cysteine S-methyltransferase [Gammaproteobacteria bacterium]MBU1787166.1 methylated-DNA--[protein]-cysteine S-methyltransferase [Gammaproteobacteria bacterium]